MCERLLWAEAEVFNISVNAHATRDFRMQLQPAVYITCGDHMYSHYLM